VGYGPVVVTVSGQLSVPSSGVKKSKMVFFLDFLNHEGGTDRLSRNVGTELQLYAA